MRGYKSPLAIMLRVYVQGWTEAGSGGVRRDDPWIQVEHGLGSAAAATVPPRHLKKDAERLKAGRKRVRTIQNSPAVK
ncbi:uncharacterized protein LOC144535980 isoform X3 [Sander vitreus]